MKKDIYIGIDVGKSGGFAKLDKDLNIISMHVMPMIGKEYDIQAIKDILSNPNENILHLAIENVHAIQGRAGATSNFQFGLGKGILMGVTAGLEIPYTLVNQQIKTIKVINVTKSPHTDRNIVEFDEVWAVAGDLLEDYNDSEHDIYLEVLYKGYGTLVSAPDTLFYYKGNAKVGEIYFVKHHKCPSK